MDSEVSRALCRLYTAGYNSGHHATVEGGFADVSYDDAGWYFEEAVSELLADPACAALAAAHVVIERVNMCWHCGGREGDPWCQECVNTHGIAKLAAPKAAGHYPSVTAPEAVYDEQAGHYLVRMKSTVKVLDREGAEIWNHCRRECLAATHELLGAAEDFRGCTAGDDGGLSAHLACVRLDAAIAAFSPQPIG